jgi:gas vesicle protein
MNARESGTIYFIAGLLLGGIVGAGIGMLTAPEDAEKTREQLKKTGAKVWKSSLTALEKFEEQQFTPAINKLASTVKEQVDNVQTEGVEKTVNKVIAKVQSAVQQAQEQEKEDDQEPVAKVKKTVKEVKIVK